MRNLVLLLSLIFSAQLLADSKFTSKIHDIDLGKRPGDDVLVFLSSGDVVMVGTWNLKLIEDLHAAKSSEEWMDLTVSEERIILKAKTVEAPVLAVEVSKSFNQVENTEYLPTTVESMKVATSYIRESKHPRKSETQCFNRAMVWTYEWWIRHSLRSNKVFVFWTKDYVREKKFKWWFHVAPYVHVMDTDGVVKERVLDVKWLPKPYAFQEWADYHSSHDVKCKVVEKYSEYADFPFGEDRCYFMRTNMYTWQPADLEMQEAWGYNKNDFHMDEVRAAYLEAFNLKY